MALTTNDITTITALKAAYPVLVAKIIKEARGEDTEIKIQITKDKKGDIAEWTEEIRDSEDNLISKRVDKYSFYASGEINIITQQVWDNKGQMAERQVKHCIDGKQPNVKKNKAILNAL